MTTESVFSAETYRFADLTVAVRSDSPAFAEFFANLYHRFRAFDQKVASLTFQLSAADGTLALAGEPILAAEPDVVLLDNMKPARLREAARRRDRLFGDKGPALEASGGVTLRNVAVIAATGVDRISVGALTHSAPNLDVSLEIRPG